MTLTSADYWRAAHATINTSRGASYRYDQTWDYWRGVSDACSFVIDSPPTWLLDRAAADMLAARLDTLELRTLTFELMEAAA